MRSQRSPAARRDPRGLNTLEGASSDGEQSKELGTPRDLLLPSCAPVLCVWVFFPLSPLHCISLAIFGFSGTGKEICYGLGEGGANI